MAILYLVRHGEAIAGWDEDADPGLSERGRAQAEAVAVTLSSRGPLPIITSNMERCQQTAAPLAATWETEARIEPRVAEVPTPQGCDLPGRGPWLHGVLDGRWASHAADLCWWRDAVVDCLLALPDDTVVFTHFVAVNVAVGAATGDERVVCCRPDNCSVTTVANDGGALRVLDGPDESRTEVL